jgi:hypothetical protein
MLVSELVALLTKLPQDVPVGTWGIGINAGYLCDVIDARVSSFPNTGEEYAIIDPGIFALTSRNLTPEEYAKSQEGQEPPYMPHPLSSLFE